MNQSLDFAGLNARLLPSALDYCRRWLPGGKKQGHEYVCASLHGGPGRSLSVNLNTGKWADFAAGAAGGDLISLYAGARGLAMGEAFRELASLSGYDGGAVAQLPPDDPPVVMPPPDAGEPPWGNPSARWAYRNARGEVMFWIVRYDKPDGKLIHPFGWSGVRKQWVKRSWPAPRPLFGLELLAQRKPDAPVLLVEGEKAAEAARVLLGQAYLVMTWPGGAQGINRVDWTPLKGHPVVIWPDADEPGARAARNIATILFRDVPEVKILCGLSGQAPEGAAGPILDADDGTLPLGWDAADAVAERWDTPRVVAWARPRARVFIPEAPQVVEPVPVPKEKPLKAELEVTVKKDHARLPQSVAVIAEKYGLATLGKSGLPLCNVENVVRVLDLVPGFQDMVWWDDFHGRLFSEAGVWQDKDTLALLVRFQRELGFQRLSDEQLYKALTVAGWARRRNEPRDWLGGLAWDKTDRIEAFFVDVFGAEDSEYTRAVSRNWWISMVARVFAPGCQVDNMVVLEGAQGAGKSTALRLIGGRWFAEATESVLSKDFYMALAGKILLEVAELDTFNRADITRIKQIVSSRSDRYRAPYARQTEDYPRSCVFVGTTNESAYLRDPTGARRFWPVEVRDVRLDLIRENRDQLFAEAVARYKAGEGWHRVPAQATAEQESRRVHDEWEPVVAEYIGDRREEGVTIHEIWTASACLNQPLVRLGRSEQWRLSHIMKVLRWKNEVIWRDGRSVRVWKPADPF